MKKSLLRIILITTFLLFLPILFRAPWGSEDFIVMGILLFSTGAFLEFAVKKLVHPTQKIIAGVVIIGIFLTIWAELAVDAVSKFLNLII